MQHEQIQTRPRTFSPTFFGEVMNFFALALLVSAAGTYVGFTYALPYILARPGLMWAIFAAELILVFTSRLWSEKRPLGYVLFALFAFLSGFTLAPLLGVSIQLYGGGLIYKALAATAMTFIATGLIGWRTEWNLTGLRGFLFAALLGMIIVSVIGIFIPWSNTFEMIFSGAGVAIFSAYTMYDFQRIKYGESRPLDAALELYLDIFNLFIFILRLMMSLRNR